MPGASPILDADSRGTDVPRRLLVAWEHPLTRAYDLVGRLDLPTAPGEPYRFGYFHRAGSVPGFRPFLELPDLEQIYESLDLFPLLENRMTPRSRSDYPAVAASVGLGADADPFEVLTRTGGRRATDTIEVVAEPTTDAVTERLGVEFLVHGVSHQRTDEALASLQPGDRLPLLCDVQNPFDDLGLTVADQRATNLGWVPRYLAPLVHRSAGRAGWEQVTVETVHVGDPLGPPHLRLLCRLSADWEPGDDLWDGPGYRIPAGILHFNPPANGDHQRLSAFLLEHLVVLARASGLIMTTETGLFAAADDYKVPDLMAAPENLWSKRGAEAGPGVLVIEILSPGDETMEKLDWYARMGLSEMLVVGRDDRSVRQWTRGTDGFVERPADEGWHNLSTIEGVQVGSGPKVRSHSGVASF